MADRGKEAQKQFQWTLGRRLNVLLLATAPVPVCILLLISTYQYEARLRGEADLRLAARAKDAGLEVYRRLVDLERDLRWVARETRGTDSDLADEPWSDRLRHIFRLADRRLPPAITLPASNAEPLWVARLRLDKACLVEARSAAGQPALWLVVPNARPDSGAVWGEIELDWLWAAGALPAEGGVRFALLGARGNKALAFAPSAAPELEARIRQIGGQGIGGVAWRNESGEHWRARFVTIPLGNGFGHPGLVAAVSELDRSETEAALLRRTSWLLALGSLLFAGYLLSAKLHSQLEPLRALIEGTRRLAAGDLTARVSVQGAVDLEQPGCSFNRMAAEIHRSFHLLEAGNEVAIAALSVVPAAESVAAAFVERISKITPPGIELVVVLTERHGASAAFLRSQAAQTADGWSADQRAQPLPPAVAEAEAWVRLDEAAAPVAGRSLRRPSIWRAIRRDGKTYGAIALLGYTETEAERHFVEALDGPSAQLGLAISRVHLIDDLERANWGALTALARAVDAKSPWTRGHSERVAGIAVAIGQQLDLSRQDLKTLRRGSLLHDVGKIGVPSTVLDKAEALTREEIDMLRSHVEKGALILEPMEGLREVLPIVWQHHERLDGSGYPRGLRGADIDPLAAVVAVADVFEALSASRPYRPARDPESGMRYLRQGVGTLFEPSCVEALEKARNHADTWPFPELAPTAFRAAMAGGPPAALGHALPGWDTSIDDREPLLPPSLQDRR